MHVGNVEVIDLTVLTDDGENASTLDLDAEKASTRHDLTEVISITDDEDKNTVATSSHRYRGSIPVGLPSRMLHQPRDIPLHVSSSRKSAAGEFKMSGADRQRVRREMRREKSERNSGRRRSIEETIEETGSQNNPSGFKGYTEPYKATLFYVDVEPLPISEISLTVSNKNGHQDFQKGRMEGELLLPAHVSLANECMEENLSFGNEPSEMHLEDDFINYMDFDEDIQKGALRYFDNMKEALSKSMYICKHCGAEGDHKTTDCRVLICLTCGARNEHSTRGCPTSKVCFSCNMKGHISKDCPNRNSSISNEGMHGFCVRCGSEIHKANECPTLWRMYIYLTEEEREAILEEREKVRGVPVGNGGEGYIGKEDWCYNCGEEGHLGDDCTAAEHPPDFPDEPSAFGVHNMLSGPFADAEARKPTRRERELREWEHDGVFDDGYGFRGPSNVGKKARDKEKARMQKEMREVESVEEAGDFDWFNRRNSRHERSRSRSPSRRKRSYSVKRTDNMENSYGNRREMSGKGRYREEEHRTTDDGHKKDGRWYYGGYEYRRSRDTNWR